MEQPHAMMEQQNMYKRTWRAPAPTLSSDAFKVVWKRQRLAEVRDAILRGDWPSPLSSDTESGDEGEDSASTSCTNSPRHAGHHRHQHDLDDRDDEEEAQFEEELQQAADAQLQVVLARLREQHAAQLQESRAAAKEVEEQHTTTTKQVAELQAQIEELKRNKHELFQQLKLASQAAAREAAAAAAAAQQAALQQQQRQWQQQMPPPPSLLPVQQGHTPFHAAGYGNQPFPVAGGMHPAQQLQQHPTTPRSVGQQLQPSGSGLLSPAARQTWPPNSPQPAPPPPPPRHMDIAPGSSGGGSMPMYQGMPRAASQVLPAFQQPQQQYALGRQGSWAAPTPGPHQQQQQQQQQQPSQFAQPGQHQQQLERSSSDAQYWPSADRPGARLERLGSDRLERLSASGFGPHTHDAGQQASGHQLARDGAEPHRQQQLQQQGLGSPYGRSPGSRPGKHMPIQGLQPPDSPEEGEALPSPPGPAIRSQLAAAAAASAAGAAAAAAAGAGSGAPPPSESGGGHGVLPPQPSPRLGLDVEPSGSMYGTPGSSGGAYRGAGYAEAAADGDTSRAVHGPGGLVLAGLRRSSSGGSTSGIGGVHALMSPTGPHRMLRDSSRAVPTTPSADPLLGRRGPSGSGSGGYRPGFYPSGPAGAAGSGGSRGREDGGLLGPDQRRSSSDGWDRFGGYMQAGEGGSVGVSSLGPGAGKPWGRQGGRGRGGSGGGYHGRG